MKVTLQAWPYASGTRKHDFRLIEKLIIAKTETTPALNTRDDELFLNADIGESHTETF